MEVKIATLVSAQRTLDEMASTKTGSHIVAYKLAVAFDTVSTVLKPFFATRDKMVKQVREDNAEYAQDVEDKLRADIEEVMLEKVDIEVSKLSLSSLSGAGIQVSGSDMFNLLWLIDYDIDDSEPTLQEAS